MKDVNSYGGHWRHYYGKFFCHASLIVDVLLAQEPFSDDVSSCLQDPTVMPGAVVYSWSHQDDVWTSLCHLGIAYINIKPLKLFHTYKMLVQKDIDFMSNVL